MKRYDYRSFKFILKLILEICVLLAGLSGCGRAEDRRGDDHDNSIYADISGEDGNISDAETLEKDPVSSESSYESSSVPAAEPVILTPAVLIPDAREAKIEGGSLSYGNLLIELPEGVEAEPIQREECGNLFTESEEGQVVDLSGAEEVYADRVFNAEFRVWIPLPPRIRLMHYLAEYDEETALLSALLSLFPTDTTGYRIYADEAKCEYGYRMLREEYCQYFIFVRGKDVYLIQEITTIGSRTTNLYAFGYLLQDKMLRWQDSGGDIEYDSETDGRAYRRIVPEEGFAFLCEYGIDGEDNDVRLYLEEDFDAPYQTMQQDIGLDIIFLTEDINFDGCPDIIGYDGQYLWDREEKTYCPAQAEITLYALRNWRFPETKTIWEHNADYLAEDGVRLLETETLWQWEGSCLVKKRECVKEVGEDSVRLYACGESPDNFLFNVTYSVEQWEQEEQEKERLMYEQFYDGMVPQEVYSVYHTMEAEARYIPQELIGELADAVSLGTEKETVEEMRSGRKLSEEEVLAFADKSVDIRLEVLDIASYNGSYVMQEADCDHDGVSDIVAQIYRGGSAGLVDYIFFRGRPDGTYVKSDTLSGFSSETFTIISWQEKNYLCRMTYDYDKKVDDGLMLFAYEDGKSVEKVSLTRYPEGYDVQIAESLPGNAGGSMSKTLSADYRPLAASVAKEALAIKEQIDGYQTINGNAEQYIAETDVKWSYQCDLDNDGEMERYEKFLWISSYMRYDTLVFDCEAGNRAGIRDFVEELRSGTGTPMMLWVETFEGKNIISVFYLTELESFKIIGYLIEDADFRRVYEVTADADYGVWQVCEVVFSGPN
ncbi:MAG: hypothetical protein K2H40_15870 [Lachnospiraceae bacterium]|nr:hypothetical protein [Lachnospiraceae bacterium]